MAQVMGGNGKPVHAAVKAALRRNRGYGQSIETRIRTALIKTIELVMSGHSLGAGVAGLLALVSSVHKLHMAY